MLHSISPLLTSFVRMALKLPKNVLAINGFGTSQFQQSIDPKSF